MSPCRRICELALILGAPLILAIVECFHPHPHDLLELDVQTWLWVHYAQIPLFPLAALAVVELVRGRTGIPAIALSVGTVAAGITLKSTGSSWGPVVLLVLSGFGISIFRTHAWPGGP